MSGEMKKVENEMMELTFKLKSKLKSKKIYISENELKTTDFNGSRIVECIIMSRDEIVSAATAYNTIIKDIYKFWNIPNKNYGLNATEALKKICKLVEVNRMSLNMIIKLKNGKLVYLKIDS